MAERPAVPADDTAAVRSVPPGIATGPVPTIRDQVADAAGTTARPTPTVTVR